MGETGHVRNLEYFNTMLAYVTGYGAAYAPSNPLLLMPALIAVRDGAEQAINDVSAMLAPWKAKVADRENIYKGIRPLATRIANNFAACGAADNVVENVESLKKQIHGARVNALPPDDPAAVDNEASGGSVSQQSYTQIAETFGKMIETVDEEPLYNPAEAPLQVATLNGLLADMQTANGAVTTAAVPLSNARMSRNNLLYNKDTGLCARAALVKKYVKSLFGADSPQYKQVSDLPFTKPRTR